MFIALSRMHNTQMEDANRVARLNRLVIIGCLWLSVPCSEQALCRSHNVLSILVFVYKIPDYFTELRSVYQKPLLGVLQGKIWSLIWAIEYLRPQRIWVFTVLVVNRVSILAMFFFLYSCLELSEFFRSSSYFFIISDKIMNKSPS